MTRVAIVGGGIGGLTAARALSRRRIEVAVYEAAPELREIGAGVALHPNAMKVLRSLGIEDDVRATAGHSKWALTRNGKTGRVISMTSRREQANLFGCAGATVHRPTCWTCWRSQCRVGTSRSGRGASRSNRTMRSRSRD
jgi:2-polyprenyl-6-methoxyphenol hydroxylase-like FAD-dependent oxidoreductase